jgi:hypothetical protein
MQLVGIPNTVDNSPHHARSSLDQKGEAQRTTAGWLPGISLLFPASLICSVFQRAWMINWALIAQRSQVMRQRGGCLYGSAPMISVAANLRALSLGEALVQAIEKKFVPSTT